MERCKRWLALALMEAWQYSDCRLTAAWRWPFDLIVWQLMNTQGRYGNDLQIELFPKFKIDPEEEW